MIEFILTLVFGTIILTAIIVLPLLLLNGLLSKDPVMFRLIEKVEELVCDFIYNIVLLWYPNIIEANVDSFSINEYKTWLDENIGKYNWIEEQIDHYQLIEFGIIKFRFRKKRDAMAFRLRFS